MELKYFRGIQDYLRVPHAGDKPSSFRHSVLYLARNKTRHLLIAEYVKTLKGSRVILCDTNDMCAALADLIPKAVTCSAQTSVAERKAAMLEYSIHGILIITVPAFMAMTQLGDPQLGLHKADHIVFTTYTYHNSVFARYVKEIGTKYFHQIVDNANIRGIVPECYARLGKMLPFECKDDYNDFIKF